MKYKIKSFSGKTVEVEPRVELYDVKDEILGKDMLGLAICLDEEFEDMDAQYAVLTVSFGTFIGVKNAAYIDVNNCPFAYQLLDYGFATDTGLTKNSGFCTYPLWVFDEEFLKKHGSENYSRYSRAYDDYMRSFE